VFKGLFRRKSSDGLSKQDYWRKWELYARFDDLFKAEELLAHIESAQANGELISFKESYVEEVYELEGDNVPDSTRIWKWFAQDGEWAMLVGLNGKELGERIFPIVDRLKQHHDSLK
jgi:hypothetical protein